MASKQKVILSFDGGGIRGIISLIFLRALEQATQINLAKEADLFAGTSTGSITAASLAIGLNVEDLINFYLEYGKKIFSNPAFVEEHSPFHPKYSQENLKSALERALEARGLNSEQTLDETVKKVVIPAVNLDEVKKQRWQLELLTNLGPTTKPPLKVIDAILRSSAAPTYFPSYQGYIDGGIGANDPSSLAYALYHSLLPQEKPPIYLLSFGTGYTDHCLPKGEDWGMLSWVIDLLSKKQATTTPLLSMIFDVQQELLAHLSKLLLGTCFHKINLYLKELIKLDDATQIEPLIEMTKQSIAANKSSFKQACAFVEKAFA